MFGYCNTCHQPILEKTFKIVRGAKVCAKCIESQKTAIEKQKQATLQGNEDREGLISLLLSMWPIKEIPQSWHEGINSMLRKGFSYKGISDTIKYCIVQGKKVREDNWSQLVYVYYVEAQENQEKWQKIMESNQKKEITSNTIFVPVRPTTYRDKLPYNIEDL